MICLSSILPLPDQILKIGTRLGPATPGAASAAIIVLRWHWNDLSCSAFLVDLITKTSVTTTSAPRTSERRLKLTVRRSERATQFHKRCTFNHFQRGFSTHGRSLSFRPLRLAWPSLPTMMWSLSSPHRRTLPGPTCSADRSQAESLSIKENSSLTTATAARVRCAERIYRRRRFRN